MENWRGIAKVKEESMRVISKDSNNLARRIAKLSYIPEELDKIKAHIVEAAFFIYAYQLGTRAFSAMIAAKNDNPEDSRGIIEFLQIGLDKIREEELKRIEEVKNAKGQHKSPEVKHESAEGESGAGGAGDPLSP